MEFANALKKEIYSVLTENGDTAFSTSGSYCLDFFYFIGGLRGNYMAGINSFIKAFYEDKLLSIKILFYARDIREGLGERDLFKMIFNYICNFNPHIARQLIEFIPVYGRFDDLWTALYTDLRPEIIELIKKQLREDLDNLENDKEISLLGKWLPSINTTSSEARELAKIISKDLNMNYEKYRKTLSLLRKGRIIENNLREKDYTFDYSKIPSQAMFKYRNAFLTNDEERYKDFLAKAEEGKVKLATNTLYPYQIVREVIKHIYDENITEAQLSALNTTWKCLERTEIASNTIVVRDGSGSMFYDNNGVCPNDVATSLSILFAESLKEPFKNTFITFSEKPKLINIKSENIVDIVKEIILNDECANTNIMAVYKLILKVAKKYKIKNEDMVKRIVIISDMEFDEGVKGETTFESFKKEFNDTGYDFPEIVFWNVCNRNMTLPTRMNENNVKLVSGSSKKIIEMITNNTSVSSYEFMIDTLKKYDILNKLDLK